MSADRYMIVYRDGYVGQLVRREIADLICDHARLLPAAYESLPAYRIRIREKVKPTPTYADLKRIAWLDPERAYREVTGRTTFAGAEK